MTLVFTSNKPLRIAKSYKTLFHAIFFISSFVKSLDTPLKKAGKELSY